MGEDSDHKAQLVDQFSRQAGPYKELAAATPVEDRRAAFLALAGVRPDDMVLDVCCGPGLMTLELAPHVMHVTGLDLTPAMLDQARAAQAERGIANARWVEGDVFALPFDDDAFTLVICIAACHHMTDPRAAFREMARVCRPGGRIVVRDVTPAVDKAAVYDRMEKLRDPSHTHALTAEEMRALGAGLSMELPELHPAVAADLPLDPILAASFPESCTIADIRDMFEEDALSGEDRLGFDARIVNGELCVSYPQTTAIWVK